MIVANMPENISNVCIHWQNKAPFFAEFLLRFIYQENAACKTLSVGFREESQKLLLVYNKKFISKLTQIETEAVCYHEILHVLHKFQDRLGVRDKEIFNVAQDACVNKTIEETTVDNRQLVLPKGGIKFKDIQEMGYKGDVVSEPVYDFLEKKAEKIYIVSTGAGSESEEGCPLCGAKPGDGKGKNKDKQDKGEGEGSSGSEEKQGEKKKCPLCGGTGHPKHTNKIILRTTDDHTGHRNLSEIEQAIIEDIVNNARTRSWGTISGNAQDYIKDILKTKNIPWQRKLAMILSRYVNEPGNIYENTWSRRNRRDLPLPGVRKLSKRVVVSVDTSGSIADEDLKKFFGQIEKIVRDFSTMTLIQWDTQVHSVETYKKGFWKKIKIQGRGGTNPQDLYDHLKEIKKVSVVINFTDSYFDWNFKHYDIPTVWAVINNPNFSAPFGKTILIEDDEESKNRNHLRMR